MTTVVEVFGTEGTVAGMIGQTLTAHREKVTRQEGQHRKVLSFRKVNCKLRHF